jgi:hypothetical protein
VRPDGRGSLTVTAPAESGPLLATVTVKVMIEPSLGDPVEPVFAIVTLAPGTRFTETPADVDVWPEELGVESDCVSVAMFVIVPDPAATTTVTERLAESPFATVPSVQVSVGTPLMRASLTVVEAPSTVDGAIVSISVAVSLDMDCVAAADIVADVLLPTAVIIVPAGIPKPETTSPTCPALKLPPGPVSVVEPAEIEAADTDVTGPYET